jgi:tetratricopeptide (TPR) repeat protein
MNNGQKSELRIDIPLAVFLALASFGYENLELPHSKMVGLISWAVCLVLLIRIVAIAWTLVASTANVTFKDASALSWWRRQVIKYDIANMHSYFAELEIPVPDTIPPVTVHEEGQAIFNPPHLYRGELKIPRLEIADRRVVTHIYAVYVMNEAFPDLTQPAPFWDDLQKNTPRLALTNFFSIELRRYLHASYWNSIDPQSPPGALLLWKIREALGRAFTDRLASKVYQLAADSIMEIFDPDLNVSFTKALKIADGILEAYQQSWPKIQKILDANPIRAEFRKPDPRTDPNLIRLLDEFGREFFITKDQWRKSVLPGTLKSNWNNPDQLYGVVVDSLNDGFSADLMDAAEHLYRIDSTPARGSCIYAIVLMKSNRLAEAEDILRSYIQQHGEEGYVLTNLARVYSARNETQKAEEALWRALELDPNQENGLGWYAAIHRERSGDVAGQDALRRVAVLSSSWRAQLWLARAALDARDLAKALSYYRESLSRVKDPISSDVLMHISSDLGKHGYLRELVELTEPRFVPDLHGLQVGNNLIKAHLDLGEIEPARKILDQLYALKRPDYKPHLSFWDTEIAKVRIERTTISDPPLSVAMGTIDGPVWLKPSSPDAELFPLKLDDAPVISLLGFSAEVPRKSEHVQRNIADAPGRMSRALPLFLAEQIWFKTNAKVQTLAPWVTGKSCGFVLSGAPWRDEDAATYSLQAPMKSDFVIVIHLKADSEPWTIELRVVRSSNRESLGHLSASLQPANPERAALDIAHRLLSLMASPAQLESRIPPVSYRVPTGGNFAAYLLRLEQLLAVRCAGMDGVNPSFLNGEREIIDGNLQLCVACPENVGTRLLFARTLVAMKRVRPGLAEEFRDKILLLQQKHPLQGRSNGILQQMFKEALEV